MSLRGSWVVGCVAVVFCLVQPFVHAQAPVAQAYFTRADELVIDFAASVQVWENRVDAAAIGLHPEVPRTCRWDSDTRLACRFERTPAPATLYRIDIPAGLKTFDGTRLPALQLSAETARPELHARVDEWRIGLPLIEIVSNAPMTAQSVREALRLQVDGQPLPVPLPKRIEDTTRDEHTPRFHLALPALTGPDRLVRLDVVPGLRSTAGPLPGTQQATLLKAMVNESFALRSLSCARRDADVHAVNRDGAIVARCLPGMPIYLKFSRPLSQASRSAISREPPANMFVLMSRGWWPTPVYDDVARYREDTLILEASLAEHPYELTLDGLRSADGASLAPVRIALTTDTPLPQLQAPRTGALVADGAHPPPLVQALGGAGTTVRLEAVGARSRREDITLPATIGPLPRRVDSPVAARALADGGWVQWSAARQPSRLSYAIDSGGSAQFAAPAFDLYAVHGVREVLAWANEWDRDAAVPGAKIELLLRQTPEEEPRVVVRGTTGADGTVLLRLPDEVALPRMDDADAAARPQWLLRATQRGRRAVLPMATRWASFGQPPQRMIWGVTDRPMYRAGDTVRYRLWQRDRTGARLHRISGALPTTLRLQDDNEDKTVLQWPAMASPDGALSGTLQLPVHLTDSTYCIGIPDPRGYATEGACFFVGTYRAQDLWAKASSQGGVLHDGERFSADLTAGFYSGGTAAGVSIDTIDLAVSPLDFTDAYPAYAQYEFIDVWDDAYDYVPFDPAPTDAVPDRLDRDGAAQVRITLPIDGPASRPPFGELELSAEVAPQGRESTVAVDARTRYARYAAFVGLRTTGSASDTASAMTLDGVLVDADGRAMPGADIVVSVDFVEGHGKNLTVQPLATCTLRAGQPAPCGFARPATGLYRFTARSGDAAPARLQRYLWTDSAAVHAQVDETELKVTTHDAATTRVTLRQRFDRARALFVFGSEDRIDGYRVEAIAGNVKEFELSRPTIDERPSSQLQVYVRDVSPELVAPNEGFRAPARMETATARLSGAHADAPRTTPVSVRFEPVHAAPGTKARVVLRNDSDTPRDVALSVMDDALRTLAQPWLPYADPHGYAFLGALDSGSGRLERSGFRDLVADNPWRQLLPWPADVAHDAEPPFPEPPKELSDGFNEVSAAAATAPDGSTLLDRIQVTGSRIKRSDLIEPSTTDGPDPTLRPRAARGEAPPASSALARVRTHFADTAAWQPGLTLAPGETRTLDIDLPDNLTRWRAVAWSSDDADDFAVAEATLEAGLPLEARLQVPVRVYPGDRARVIGHVHQNGDTATDVRATLRFEGEDAPAEHAATLHLEANGQGAFAHVIAPQRETTLTAIASASAPAGNDAVAQPIEVASPRIAARKTMAGWLGSDAVALDVPTLPDGATGARVHVALHAGVSGLVDDWTAYMHAYPHRCWEQILSRAVAAALAIDRGDTSWGDAPAVVREALDNAAVFQQSDGAFRYFPGDTWVATENSAVLTAYTVEAFALLRRLGYAVDADIDSRARTLLARVSPRGAGVLDEEGIDALARFAHAAAARSDVPAAELDRLWHRWAQLPLPAQVATARAMAANAHPSAREATQRLLDATATRGEARVMASRQRYDAWMGSNLREQCRLIALLDVQSPERRALVAGLSDLYAGGAASVDTQSGAVCLAALQGMARAGTDPVVARVELGQAHGEMTLAPGESSAEWSAPLAGAPSLRIQAGAGVRPAAPTSFIAQLQYEEDARVASATAVGFAIARRYAVFRDGDWRALEGASIREGDWVRVTLVIDSTAPRRFVAVTDQVPGGLRPTDLSLSGVVVRDIARASDTGSTAFATRRLDARSPKFYAEHLPPGRHELHYFAVAGNGGDYLAAPAVAELMYGGASVARTAATRVRILADER